MIEHNHPSSFRDPDGYLFQSESGRLLRRVHPSYNEHYQHLIMSGLLDELTNRRLIVEHKENTAHEGLVLEPEVVPFISYPYEWSFSQLRNAALLTLEILATATRFGMTLKDASAYNVQFIGTRPVFIDTLSFQKCQPDEPWSAYQQFCEQFLAPLCLMSYCDPSMGRLMQVDVGGIPLARTSRMLPARSWLSPHVISHLHLHAAMQSRCADNEAPRPVRLRTNSFRALLLDLRESITELRISAASDHSWSDYYENAHCKGATFQYKAGKVNQWLGKLQPRTVWDIGSNTGVFSRAAAVVGARTVVSIDSDPLCVDENYRIAASQACEQILPLVTDVANPSPGIGWLNSERLSLWQRGPADCIMALAVVHHLALASGIPLPSIIEFFAQNCRHLIIEFPARGDEKVRKLLLNKTSDYPNYNYEVFVSELTRHFAIHETVQLPESERTLFLCERIG